MTNYNNILLTSENHIKSISPLSDSLSGKYLLPTIKIVQDVELRMTIGDCLLNALLQMVGDGSIKDEEHIAYKDLLDNYIQPYMTYKVLSEATDIVANKIVNAGVTTVNDEHQYNSSRAEKNDLKLFYLRHSDSYKRLMQEFLLANSKAFPELTECECNRIRENLHSAYSGGVWLGYTRGKDKGRGCDCR